VRIELGSCALGKEEPQLDLAALDESVLGFDEATRTHVAAIAARGRTRGRRARAVGFVGDSMTVSTGFLRDFARERAKNISLAPEVERALGTRVDGREATIIDYFQGFDAQHVRGEARDSFGALRAARVGMRANWPLIGGDDAPLAHMIRNLSPAVAVVLFGGNDAAFRAGSIADLADEFELHLGRIVDALEKEGIVPVLNTVARHAHAPGFDDCGKKSELSNWRIAVQTNAISARVVKLACARHLPLIDLRHAMDRAEHYGLGHDGIHPSVHPRGGAQLTARGLNCGYNVRNYVTLRMLKQLKEQVFEGAP
jgi:hypothetical protein